MADKTKRFYMACAFAVTLLFSLGNTTQGTLLTEFADYYSIGPLKQSFISAAASLGMAVALCVLLAGIIRVTKNVLYIAAVGAICLSLGLIGTMPGFAVFLAFYALLGVSFGFIDAIGSSLVADVSAPEKVSRNMGMLHAFYGIGGILGPLLISTAANLASGSGKGTGASVAAFMLAGVAAVLLVVNIFAFRAVKRNLPHAVKYPERPRADGLSDFLRSGSIPLLLICGLNGAYISVVTFRIVQYVTVDFASSALGALSLSSFWAGMVISRFTIPRMKISLRVYMVAGLALTGVLTAASALVGSAAAAIVLIFIAGLVSGAVTPMCVGELCLKTPDNTLLGSIAGLLSQYVSNLAGALIVGALTPDDNLGVSLLIAALYSVLGAVAAAFYRKPKKS